VVDSHQQILSLEMPVCATVDLLARPFDLARPGAAPPELTDQIIDKFHLRIAVQMNNQTAAATVADT